MFFNKNRNKECIALFDIGSSSVWGAVLVYEKGKKNMPTVLYSTRRVGMYDATQSSALSECAPVIEKVGDDLYNEAKRYHGYSFFSSTPFTSAVCVLSAPWQTGLVLDVKEKFDDVREVTSKMLTSLLSRDALESFESTASSDTKKQEIDISRIKLIEQRVLSARLNGYPTTSILGREVNRIELSGYVSMCSLQAYGEIGQWISDAVGVTPKFHSHSFLAFKALSHIFPGYRNYVYLSVTSKNTEVLYIKNNVVSFVYDFDVGYLDFIDSVRAAYDVPARTARSMLKLFSDNMMSQTGGEEMAKVVSEVKKKWDDELREVLKKCDLKKDSHIFVSSHRGFLPLFNGTSNQWNGGRVSSVISLDYELINSIIESRDYIDDIPALLDIIGINNANNNA